MSFDLLTGATGFLGSYLLRDALSAGRSVAALVRPTGRASAEARVQAVLERFGLDASADDGRLKVIEGDLHRPDLGLDSGSRSWIAEHCDRVVHCAASLAFQAKAGEPYRSNVDGTRYVLELCRTAGIGDVHLVSTAYVSGQRTGHVRENELECGQAFSNDYERSKFMSETLVRNASFLDRWTVYRPSVVVGDSVTGFTSSDDGLYAFLRLSRLFSGNSEEQVLDRLGLTAEDRLNMVPVDWVSAVVIHLLGNSGEPGTTYHLTHPAPVAVVKILAATRDLSVDAPRLPARALDDVLAVYRPYLRDHCEFDRTNVDAQAAHLPCPPLEGAVLERLARFVQEHQFGAVASASVHREIALVLDGPGGGAFDLTSPDSVAEIQPDEVNTARVRAYCTSDTAASVTAGDISVEQAIRSGLLMLEGDTADFDRAAGRVQTYLGSAR